MHLYIHTRCLVVVVEGGMTARSPHPNLQNLSQEPCNPFFRYKKKCHVSSERRGTWLSKDSFSFIVRKLLCIMTLEWFPSAISTRNNSNYYFSSVYSNDMIVFLKICSIIVSNDIRSFDSDFCSFQFQSSRFFFSLSKRVTWFS